MSDVTEKEWYLKMKEAETNLYLAQTKLANKEIKAMKTNKIISTLSLIANLTLLALATLGCEKEPINTSYFIVDNKEIEEFKPYELWKTDEHGVKYLHLIQNEDDDRYKEGTVIGYEMDITILEKENPVNFGLANSNGGHNLTSMTIFYNTPHSGITNNRPWSNKINKGRGMLIKDNDTLLIINISTGHNPHQARLWGDIWVETKENCILESINDGWKILSINDDEEWNLDNFNCN